MNLCCQLKARKLEELAEQIRSDRAKHDAKGKQVESSNGGETEKTSQNQIGDTNNSEGNVASINQEKVDGMYVSAHNFSCCFLVKVSELIFLLHVLRLAASLAAEEDTDFTDEGTHHLTSAPLPEGDEIDEDEDDDEGMIFVSVYFP